MSNINACTAVADVVRTTLGPRGMDKLIHDDKGNVTISNDGATIMKLLDIVHPAAKILVDIAKSQDSEVTFSLLSISTFCCWFRNFSQFSVKVWFNSSTFSIIELRF